MATAHVPRDGLAGRLFARLVDGEGDPAADFPRPTREAIPGNFFRQIGAIFLVQLGDVLTGPKITLAWLLGAIGAPAYLIALLVPIRESGSMLPQIAIAGFVRRQSVRKWIWVAGAVVQALAVAGIGASAMLLDGAAAGWTIIALLVVFSLARAFSSIAAKDVLGRTIPKTWRGQTTAWAASTAGLVTIGAGIALLLLAGSRENAGDYAAIVLAAASLWLLAGAIYAGMREFADVDADADATSPDQAGTLDLLRSDPVLRRFVITRCLLLCTALSAPFYVGLAQAALGSPATLFGAFIVASGLASLLSSPFWGRLADRSSRQVMMLGAMLASGTGLAVVAIDTFDGALFEAQWLLPALYFMLTIAHQGARIGRKTYVVDIAAGDQRTDYVAVSNTTVGLVLLGAGVLGAIGAAFSTPLVILVLSLLGLARISHTPRHAAVDRVFLGTPGRCCSGADPEAAVGSLLAADFRTVMRLERCHWRISGVGLPRQCVGLRSVRRS